MSVCVCVCVCVLMKFLKPELFLFFYLKHNWKDTVNPTKPQAQVCMKLCCCTLHTLYEVPVFDCLAVQDCVLAANKDVSWLLTINILPIKDEE